MTFKVLIVDDSKLARMAVAKALNAVQPGWTRVEASNADEAVALALDGSVGLALLDYNMPGRDGLELAGELKTLQPNLRVAIISANHQAEVVSQARALGAEFLPKPLTEQSLSAYLASSGTSAEAEAR